MLSASTPVLVHPGVFIAMLYALIGLVVTVVAVAIEPEEIVDEPWYIILLYALLCVLAWPFMVVLGIVATCIALHKAIKEIRQGMKYKSASAENERLKEEIERLKDKLYEVEG